MEFINRMSDNILNSEEAAKFLGVSVKTLYRYRNNNQLPSYTLPGGELRYKKSDLLKWLDKKKV